MQGRGEVPISAAKGTGEVALPDFRGLYTIATSASGSIVRFLLSPNEVANSVKRPLAWFALKWAARATRLLPHSSAK
jgi:hypothetical protein